MDFSTACQRLCCPSSHLGSNSKAVVHDGIPCLLFVLLTYKFKYVLTQYYSFLPSLTAAVIYFLDYNFLKY